LVLHLRDDRSLAPRTINLAAAALRFFYEHVVRAPLSLGDVPRMKAGRALPKVYSEQEVERIIAALNSPKHRLSARKALRQKGIWVIGGVPTEEQPVSPVPERRTPNSSPRMESRPGTSHKARDGRERLFRGLVEGPQGNRGSAQNNADVADRVLSMHGSGLHCTRRICSLRCRLGANGRRRP
jgi:integrase